MILFVDIEHETGFSQPWGERLRAARTWLTYRLEDLIGDDVHLVRYTKVDEGLIERLRPRAMLLSGNSSEPDVYEPGSRDALHRCIRDSGLPVFGFCGGHQVVASAFGVDLERIEPERGNLAVTITSDHPILDGIARDAVYRHSHSWQISRVPHGFTSLASTDASPHQIIVNDELHIVGTQFHPEYWNDDRPAGARMIANFVEWSGLSR